MHDDEGFQQYIELLSQDLTNPKLYEFVSFDMSNSSSKSLIHIGMLFEYNLRIFQKFRQNTKMLQISSIILMNLLQVRNQKSFWEDDSISHLQESIKNEMLSGMCHEDIVIRNVCARIITSIAISEKNYEQLLNMLIMNILNNQSGNYSLYGSIRCISEIFSFQVYFVPFSKQEYYPALIDMLLGMIQNPQLPLSALIDTTNVLIGFLRYDLPLISNELLNQILNGIENTLNDNPISHENHTFYQVILDLLYYIFDIYYHSIEEYIDHYIRIILNEINNTSDIIKLICMNLLHDIARFEYKKEKYGCSIHNIVNRIAPIFVEPMLNCLVTESSFILSNESIYDVQFACISALQAFYRCDSEVIFQKIVNFFKLIKDSDIQKNLAALNSLHVVCVKPHLEVVSNFLIDIFPALLKYSYLNAVDIHTKYSSIHSINSILLYYPEILNNDDIVNDLIKMFCETMTNTSFPVFIQDSCDFFTTLSSHCNPTLLDESFEQVISAIFEKISLEHNFELRFLFSAMNSLIEYCTEESNQNINYLLSLLFSFALKVDEDIEKRSNSLLTIELIFRKIPEFIIPNLDSVKSFIMSIIDTNNNLLSNSNNNDVSSIDSDLWGCGLISLSSLIEISKEQFIPYINETLNNIYSIFKTDEKDEWLLKAGLNALSKLYEFTNDSMKSQFGKTHDLIFSFIKNNSQEIVFPLYSSIIKVFGQMLNLLQYLNFKINNQIEGIIGEIVKVSSLCMNYKFKLDIPGYENLVINILSAYKLLFIGLHSKKQYLLYMSNSIFPFMEFVKNSNFVTTEIMTIIYQLLLIICASLTTRIITDKNMEIFESLLAYSAEKPDDIELHQKACEFSEVITKLIKELEEKQGMNEDDQEVDDDDEIEEEWEIEKSPSI
ncbi:hypothetical protein TRFO_04058 [Tritrichomonas foetus]|uniref:Importin N-terminal domain-containing protein n=1 Tax=Tritrichomonas foetus TaxID=1144522 RepID=A0A1J4KIA8_9EUKA|nr:hypothetical protein TRFO_04058 [Tritrichomonas foetus]|eukprot:OHT11105.1 hypothetical protein TRFO_04058 [Tritrichomonas foetus]